ncbi:hypothetical protein AOC36_00160 [Erysipelothrix larvae]|uniref:Hydrolase TatD n=1 Tax=Erysipelothrix larvae TaxID=1514105 RepID=A0A109UGD0_9FIRM|nr:TatD family hydrolase [Erysipelothrix larvae]AMC92460.1 hypothetical protein AOC36_00160 [Erysipelothrix larvae]
MNGWIDSHAHIASDPLKDRFDDIKQEAFAHGVTKICIICGNLAEIEFALLKAENDPMFDFAVGVHPGSVHEISDKEYDKMMQYLDAPQVKFVGEIGLDYYWDTTYVDLQKARLIQQIERANAKNLPVAIHMRSSVDDVLETLKTHPVNRCGILHCFSETTTHAKTGIELGYTLGVGGVFTFKNGQNVRDVVDTVPLNRIITETDSPYLTPVPFRGKENRPAMVSYVAEALAKHLEMSHEEMQDRLWKNYLNLTQ